MVLAGLSVLLQLWKELIIFPLGSLLALVSNNLWIVIMRFAASPSCQNFLQNDAFASILLISIVGNTLLSFFLFTNFLLDFVEAICCLFSSLFTSTLG